MSMIANPDKIIRAYSSNKKEHIMQDVFIGRQYAFPGAGRYGTIMRLNSNLEPVWRRSLFLEDGYYGGDVQGRECALTKNGEFLFVVGANPTPGTDNFYKLNSLTGETIWSKESTNPYYKLAVDNKGDAIIWEEHNPGTGMVGALRKYTAAGVIAWTINLNKISAIATDSECNIYITHVDEVGGNTLRKLYPDGSPSWETPIHSGGNSHGGDVAINKDDDIFVVGSASGTYGNYHRIYKYSPSSDTLVDSAPVGDGTHADVVWSVVTDSKGNVIAAAFDVVDKLSSSLTSQWYGIYSSGINVQLATDVHNRVHIFSARHDGDEGGYLILDENENFVSYNDPYKWEIMSAVLAKEVYVAHFTDQSVNMFREDMCCFQDDGITEFVENPPSGTWNTNDVCYSDWLFGIGGEHLTGIFKSLVDNNDAMMPGENDLAWEMLNLVPPCGNEYWNDFPGFGGIGNSPQIYTISIIGMRIVSDGASSPYNGEYLIRRGPGTFGFFVGVQHDNKTRINFEAEDNKDSAGSETLQFGTESLISSIFNYTAASAGTGKWIDIVNSNTDSAPNIAYGGTASLYPGKRARWDNTTIWTTNIIIAWEGSFYQANNQNVNSEPPSGNWTEL